MATNTYPNVNSLPASAPIEVGAPAEEQRPRVSITRSLIRGLRRHPVLLAAPFLGLLLLGYGLVSTLNALIVGSSSDRVEVLGAQVANGAPPMAAQSMEGMKRLDAQMFWTALDDRMRASLAAQGIQGVEGVAQMFSQIRSTGQAISSYQYVARHINSSGETVSFFMAQRKSANGDLVDVPFLITTNRQGQVTKLE